MADEITVTAGLSFTKGNRTAEMRVLRQQLDMSGTNYVLRDQNVGTSAEALDIGEITTCGWCCIWNLDSTNYVTLRAGSGGADVVKVKAGEQMVFRLATNTPYAIANTAACDIVYLIAED